MGTLTVKLKDHDEMEVDRIKAKHNIATKTKALLFCLHNQVKLENEIDLLQRERMDLLNKLEQYKAHSLELLSGIAGLQELSTV